MVKKAIAVFLVSAALAGFSACGLEEYYYLEPVAEGRVTTSISQATIALPGSGADGYSNFSNFIIFYRIYLSDYQIDGVSKDDTATMSSINGSLSSAYNAIKPHTDVTSSTVNTSIGDLFRNYQFYELALEGINIEGVLSGSSLGNTMDINFPPNRGATMRLNGNEYNLYRSTNGGVFKPEPDRYFFNSPELRDRNNLKPTLSADVTDKSQVAADQLRYSYVLMYIAAYGRYTLNFFYSRPTFVGIFRLAERTN
jgi:hypothetical protein